MSLVHYYCVMIIFLLILFFIFVLSFFFFFFFFFKQKTAYEMQRGLVGSEMCIRDSINAEYMGLAARNGKSIGIIIADIDNFKKLNDAYGHSAGDKALKTAAFILESSLRKSDVSGRYGGEEFIVFTYNAQPEDLHALCERIRANIENNSENLCGNAFTISLGAAAGNIEDPSPDALMGLIDIADKNLYQAKTNGKNTYTVSRNASRKQISTASLSDHCCGRQEYDNVPLSWRWRHDTFLYPEPIWHVPEVSIPKNRHPYFL
eukprot:TRINITY_DN2482_c0_g1_i4.p1 TRINITY_DN2482_c0_g1~~TRINITY_DN2482_c0_g1_i4.p1  ORF type:complete len:262 (-),score=59.92 TRINITY_DN2482_c0_g1_i4:196-981(-)